MRIEFRIGYLDHLRYQVVHQFMSPVVNGFYLLIPSLIFLAEIQDNTVADGLGTALAFYLAIWLAQVVFTAIYVFTRRADSVLTDHVIEIQSDGLYEATKYNQSKFFWPGILRVVTRPGFIAIYVAQHMAHVVPTRAFRTKEERDTFVSVLRERMRAV